MLSITYVFGNVVSCKYWQQTLLVYYIVMIPFRAAIVQIYYLVVFFIYHTYDAKFITYDSVIFQFS